MLASINSFDNRQIKLSNFASVQKLRNGEKINQAQTLVRGDGIIFRPPASLIKFCTTGKLGWV